MKNDQQNNPKDIQIDSDEVVIKDDSKITYVTGIGVAGSENDIKLLLIQERLINGKNGVGVKQESNQQIVMTIETAKNLNKLLSYQLKNSGMLKALQENP